ncbi:cyclin-Q isoform X4 [Leucoraja erinacea]|uniref:cyclin-Q isoform X4 n=1 Tax=Leucoraja erinaceus TaxID=7782 RepID=UPI0024562E95|nr:cyclin-Q isoform X4 [Leucoraja erinacea]
MMEEEEEEESRRERLHFRVCRFILESGVKLGLGSLPLASACTIYHRFVARTAPGAYDPYLVATAAIFLAGKVEEQHLRARDILNVCHRYLYPRLPPLQVHRQLFSILGSRGLPVYVLLDQQRSRPRRSQNGLCGPQGGRDTGLQSWPHRSAVGMDLPTLAGPKFQSPGRRGQIRSADRPWKS